MYIYAVLLAIGILGIVGMSLTGFLHIGPHAHSGHGGAAGHGHIGHGPMAHGHLGHGHAAHGTGHGGAHHGAHAGHGNFATQLKSLFSISPLDIFSYCAGAGMAAFLARPYIAKNWLPIPAIIGALIFDLFVTRMIMNTISKFGANPSAGLEGTVATEGTAVTNFDANGQGLVKLTLDGQIVQLLATLELAERHNGVQVHKGDSVLIVEVDSSKNRCMVTRELSLQAQPQAVLKLEGKS